MKKVLLILLVVLLVGCSKESNKEEQKETKTTKEEVVEKEEYQDDNPIKLGLYSSSDSYSNKKLIEDAYYTTFTNGVDLGSFEVYYTNDKVLSGTSFKDIWNKYYNDYTDIDNYKIGYNIKFILSDGTNFDNTFLEPDIFKFGDYFYVYMYDDVHQKDGAFYSHIEEMEDNTLMTSIKIYGVDNIDKVENIILSVFTYDSDDDFDEEGNYRGISRYAIRIKKNR